MVRLSVLSAPDGDRNPASLTKTIVYLISNHHTHRAAVAAQASDRPLQGWGEGPCLRVAEGIARGSWASLWARPMVYIPGGGGTASACPVPHAIRRPG